MWEHLVEEKRAVPVTVLLLGSEICAQFSQDSNTVVSFSKLSEFDAFLFGKFRPDIVNDLSWDGDGVAIASFDWLRVDQWSEKVNELVDICEKHDVKLILSSHNFEQATRGVNASLSQEIDFGHQFLRTIALKLHASALVYPLESFSPSTWHAVLHKVIGRDTTSNAPEPNFIGNPTVIYEDDSQEKILTLNPDFNFIAAFDNKLSLKPLASPPEPEWRPLLSLPALLEQVITESQEPRHTTTVKKVITENSERKMMSDFFSSLEQRSTV